MSRRDEFESEIGNVTAIRDCGSIVQVFIDDVPYAADGNAWRRGGAAEFINVGDQVSFSTNDWGGLAGIAPVED